MKNIFILLLALYGLSGFAQTKKTTAPLKENKICTERGHNLVYSKNTVFGTPYTIDSPDSTITVYPIPYATLAHCSRCGAEIESTEKELRITTWRRSERAPLSQTPRILQAANWEKTEVNTKTSEAAIPASSINWGKNLQRALDKPVKTGSLDDIKKVATLRNDTLYIHKRIAPFNNIPEQLNGLGLSSIIYKNKELLFRTAVYDEADVFAGSEGLQIY